MRASRDALGTTKSNAKAYIAASVQVEAHCPPGPLDRGAGSEDCACRRSVVGDGALSVQTRSVTEEIKSERSIYRGPRVLHQVGSASTSSAAAVLPIQRSDGPCDNLAVRAKERRMIAWARKSMPRHLRGDMNEAARPPEGS